MNLATNTTYLQKQIAFAHVLKKHTNQILEIINPGHHLAEANLQLLAEKIFKYLSDNQSNLDQKELKALSSLVHRHSAAYNRIKSLELKTLKLVEKQFLELNLQDLPLPTDREVSITPDAAPEVTIQKNISSSEDSPIDSSVQNTTVSKNILLSIVADASNTDSQNTSLIKKSNSSYEDFARKHNFSAFSSYLKDPIDLNDLMKDLAKDLTGKNVPDALEKNAKPFSAKQLSFLLNSNSSYNYQSPFSFQIKQK